MSNVAVGLASKHKGKHHECVSLTGQGIVAATAAGDWFVAASVETLEVAFAMRVVVTVTLTHAAKI